MQVYINRQGQQTGPFTEAEVRAQLAAGTLSLGDSVWWQGAAGWMPLGQSPYALPVGAPAVAAATAPPAPQATSQLAIWSLVSGVAGFVCCLPFLPAIILGHMGLSETKKNPRLQGRGMALAGTILGYVGLVLFTLYFIVMVLIALGQQVKRALPPVTIPSSQQDH